MKWLAFLLILLPMVASAAIDAYPFPDEELEARYNNLIDELRCPQCLNTNLAGSDAMIAQDLRREVHRLLLDGKSDQEILDFMHARYGDFILYEPRVNGATFVLWFGPLILLIIGAVIAIMIVQQRRTDDAPGLSDDETSRLNRLLEK